MNSRQPYCPQISRTTAAPIRVDTCDTRRSTPSCATARGNRAVVPPGHGGRGVPLTYRALAPAGAGTGRRVCAGTSESQPTAHYSLLTANSTYTFSAKEKDPETGLSYFGSRYYSSDLSIWLSVDPMAAKYPYQSNYVYCSNNPIKVVDPNGEDEWDLSRDGYLTKRENGRTDVDVVYATDKNGKEISRYYKAGTINHNHESYPGVLYEGQPTEIRFNTDIMTFTDADIATDFFEFAAENTDKEWALNIGETETIVGTSHQDVFNQVRSPEKLQYQIHSHWSYSHKLSSRGSNGEPCPTCDIPMMINNPNTYKVYEAFSHRYVSMDDQQSYRYEISKNIQKSINLFQTVNHFWFK